MTGLVDTADFVAADRGFLRALSPAVVSADDGRVIWDADAYSFLNDDCPATANPSLWRQGQLCSKQGLYEVTDGIYQVRGLDLSNMTLVEGETGVIVIDPLVSVETAASALALYRSERGDRPVTAVIYTHSHVDHFGGVRGVIGDNPDGVPIVAPEGFLGHAVSENVYAGPAMTRRAVYMYGQLLPVGPDGQIGCGLGQNTSKGTISLLAPTLDITHTGQEETFDGVRIVFQMTPGTEAPSEMNFLFPDQRALCLAENVTHNLHNILTLRGAVVRDAHGWSCYIDEAIGLFADKCDVAFASHHWPTWGRNEIETFMAGQRDLYAYLHDQTLRLMNQGFIGSEIAEQIDSNMPPTLQAAWHTHGYYGSVSHNVKAIYQSYLGWFDGHPSSLWELPPEDSAIRYVEALGGISATIEMARQHADQGDLRFAAQLLKHAVFAEPANTEATQALAGVFTRLAYGAENGTWRNFYLTGAMELRNGIKSAPLMLAPRDVMFALTIEQLLDSVSIRVNGPKAWNEALEIVLNIDDIGETHRLTLSNGALTHHPAGPDDDDGDLSLTLHKAELLALLAGKPPTPLRHAGDVSVLARLVSVFDEPDANFAIVTP